MPASFFCERAKTTFAVGCLLALVLTPASAPGQTKSKRTTDQGSADLQLQLAPVWVPTLRFTQSRRGNFTPNQPPISGGSLLLGSPQSFPLDTPGRSTGIWTPLATPAATINESWNGGTGDWNVASDWNPAGVPNNGTPTGTNYNVTIDSGGTDVVVLNMNATISSLVLGGTTGSATLENLSGKAETLKVTGPTTIEIPGILTFGNGSSLTFSKGLTVGGSFDLTGATAAITGTGTFEANSSTTIAGGSALTANGTLVNDSAAFYTGYAYGGGNTLTVNGGLTNSGGLYMFGNGYGIGGDTLNVTGTLTNNAGATLELLDNSLDAAKIGTLSNFGTVYIGAGTALNLTNQPNGVTDVPLGSTLTVNGTLTAGTANGLAKLGSVEGTLTLANHQSTADTPGGGTLSLASSGNLTLNHTGTTLSVTGGLSDSGTLNIDNGASLNATQGLTVNSGSSVDLLGGGALTVTGNLTNSSSTFYTGYSTGGNSLTVNGGLTNSGGLYLFGEYYSGAGDTLNVTGTVTNNAGATLELLDNSGDVARIGTLANSGSVYIGAGSTLNLTNQSNGITDVPLGSTLTVNGTLTAGTANGLAKLGSVEGTLVLASRQATADTPGGGTLTLAAGGTFVLNHTGTTLSVTGALSDSGTLDVDNGAAVSLTQGMTLNSGSSLELAGGGALTVTGTLTNNSTALYTGYTNGGNTLTVNGALTNSGGFYIFGEYYAGASDTLNVTGAVTNNAGATLELLDNSGDVANVGSLGNSGSVYIGTGSTLNLTNQPNGITDVPLGSTLTVNGTLAAGGSNGLAKLAGVEGTLILANRQATADTPSSGTLTLAAGSNVTLDRTGTTLSVTGGLSDSGALNIFNGAALNPTQSVTMNSGGLLELAGGSTMTVTGNMINNSEIVTGYPYGGGNKLTVNGGWKNSGELYMYGESYGGAGDTLSVSGTFTNNAGATLDLVAASDDVATVGKLTNAGTINILSGTTLSTGSGTFTQTAGSTTVDGTLKSTNASSTAINISGGSLFGNGGTLGGNVTDQGAFVVGDALLEAGLETVTGKYTQGSSGALDIGIGGAIVGTQYGQLDISSVAMLNGTLNLALIAGFVPTLGEMFDILNASGVSGTFATVNGTSINSSEEFSVIYNATNVTLDVVSTADSEAGGAGPAGTPEPASLLLLATGLIVLLVGWRYRSRIAGLAQP